MGNFHFEGHSSEPSAALFDLPGETSSLQLRGASSISRRAQAAEIRSILRRSNRGSAPQATAQDHIGDAGPDPGAVAARGVAGGGGRLPHLDAIQQSFGRHDVTSVRAHVGGAAAQAASALEAEAYATGEDVAFAAPPDLHTAAHEAAHVVQQRAGVSLKGGMGRAGDVYERHADQVADAVVQGRSAEALLDAMPGGGGGGGGVQRREAGGAKHPGKAKYDRTPRFTHVDTWATGEARYPEPAEFELNPVGFEGLSPGALGPETGMPTPLDVGQLAFIRYSVGQWRDGHEGGTTPIVVDRRREYTDGQRGMVQGQEVDALHRWVRDHQTVAAALRSIKPMFDVLREREVVDSHFQILHKEALAQMLSHVADSGRTDRYPPSNDLDHSSRMLTASGRLLTTEIELAKYEIDVRQMEARLVGLRAKAKAIRADIKRHELSGKLRVAKSKLVALQSVRQEVFKALDFATGLVSGGVTVWKGLADLASIGGGTDEGHQTAYIGALGIANAVGTGLSQFILAPKLREQRDEVTTLQEQLHHQEREVLVMRCKGLQAEVVEIAEADRALLKLVGPLAMARQIALGNLGTSAAGALASMENVESAAGEPFSGHTRLGRGNTQRTFANMLVLEEIRTLAEPLPWPKVMGSIPLGSYLATYGHDALLNHIAEDAARFRWWQARIDGTNALLSTVRDTIKAIQLNPRNR